jgi:hypothetical protein
VSDLNPSSRCTKLKIQGTHTIRYRSLPTQDREVRLIHFVLATLHPFCKVCGVQVYMHVYGPKFKEEWSEETRKMVRGKCEIVPVRVAALEGVKWDELKVERSDEGTEGYVLD